MNTLNKNRESRSDLSIDAATKTIYGCEELFDLEAEDALLSLSFQGDPFLDWLGWSATNICVIKKYFMAWVRPDKNISQEFTEGWLGDPCADPHSFEWDTCDFTLTDFARLRRMGPVRDITKTALQYTWNQPRYRLDGTVIADDREFDARLAMEVLLQDLRLMAIEGNAATPGQFDGLQQLVKYNYRNSVGNCCRMMDSIVVDWGGNGMDGGDNITWNGQAVGNGYSFIDLLISMYRKIRKRLRSAPVLASQTLGYGDMVLVIPEDFVNCVLDAYTCWSVCSGDFTLLDTYEARTFRNGLLGGKFGAGEITIDSFKIPLLPFDYGMINSVNNFDAYLLTGNVGTIKTLYGEYNDMKKAITGITQPRFAVDGGRYLLWEDYTHTCEQRFLEFQPRVLNWAPWAQGRISDISCDVMGGISSADPTSEYFLYKDDDDCGEGQ
jgi:hypothetical protein